MTDYTQVENALIHLTGLLPEIQIKNIDVRGLTKNPHPKAMQLLIEHPLLREKVFSPSLHAECRRNLASNSSKEAIRQLSIILKTMVERKEDITCEIACLSRNPAKPAVMHLMNCQQKYYKYIDWNAVYNNPCELAQWWVSMKTKVTPKLFQKCVKNPCSVEQDKEVTLYTLADRQDDDAVVIIENFITGDWENWFEENSRMKPIVEREWNNAMNDPLFWRILCGNKNPRIIKLLFAKKCEIDWGVLSSNPAIFEPIE